MKAEKDLIKDLIEGSGNNFHFKVVEFLREKKWEILISPYYTDNITDKPREIDIVAEKEFVVNNWMPIRTSPIGNLNVKLFIECKYIDSETVFWFDDKDREKAIKRVSIDTSLKSPDVNVGINKHHYLSNNQVAKLFVSSRSRSQENEIIYRALNQSLNAMVYYKNTGSIISEEKNNALEILKTVNYSLVLCNSFDKFYRVDSEKREGYSKIDKNFQLEVNYAYLDKDKNSKSDYFLVDIIDFNRFDKFLEMLEKADIGAIRGGLGTLHQG